MYQDSPKSWHRAGRAHHLIDYCRTNNAVQTDGSRPGAPGTARIGHGGMAVQLATILPALIIAHVLGLVLLLYSLEKTFGVVSRARKRFSIRSKRGVAADLCETDRSDTSRRTEEREAPFESAPSEHSIGSSQGKAAVQDEPAFCAVSEPWIRGCSCQVGHADMFMAFQWSERLQSCAVNISGWSLYFANTALRPA